jgi:arylsulfatase A-like enzyme
MAEQVPPTRSPRRLVAGVAVHLLLLASAVVLPAAPAAASPRAAVSAASTRVTASAAAARAAGSAYPAAVAAAAARPNVLLVNTDDQRADSMDVLPKTRRWLASGVNLPQFQVAIPSCCPSRADMFTGRYPHNNGVRKQDDAANLDTATILPRYLKGAGYRTAMAGKFLNSWPSKQAPPSFDKYAYIKGGYVDYYAWVNGQNKHLLSSEAPRNYSTLWLGDQLRGYLRGFEQDDDTPWFAYYAPQAPHTVSPDGLAKPEPKYASADVGNCRRPNETDRADKPEQVRWRSYQADRYLKLCQSQRRSLLSVDDVMDEIFKQLEADGELANTLVIFTSDNGYLWGEHGLSGKFLPYLPSVKVPFLMRWDGHVAAGVDNRLAVNVDIMPTILEAAGVAVPSGAPRLDGESLLGPGRRTGIFTEYFSDPANGNLWEWAAYYDGRVHYVEYKTNSGDRVREYYNLAADPAEDLNLLGDSSTANNPPAAELSALSSRLATLRTAAGPAMIPR